MVASYNVDEFLQLLNNSDSDVDESEEFEEFNIFS